MVDELHSMGIKVIVSVWPSVDRKSENFWPMLDRGLLIKTERGALQTYDLWGLRGNRCVQPGNQKIRLGSLQEKLL